MDIGDAAQWAVVEFLCVGMGTNWVRNSRQQDRNYGALNEKLKNVEEELKNRDHGLSALKQGINDMKTHCAQVSGGLSEKVKGQEKL